MEYANITQSKRMEVKKTLNGNLQNKVMCDKNSGKKIFLTIFILIPLLSGTDKTKKAFKIFGSPCF
jgi:hypothetical protein